MTDFAKNAKKGIKHYVDFKEGKDVELNIDYIYSNPEEAEHEYTLIFLPLAQNEFWFIAKFCEDWK